MVTLDTSGRIAVPPADKWELASSDTYSWSDLSPFEQGYVEALFASARLRIAYDTGSTVRMERRDARFSDLSPEALERVRRDCAEFQTSVAWKGYVGGALSNPGLIDPERCGEMFWRERNGQSGGFVGAFGFPQEYAHRLHERAELFPPLQPYLADDGKIHLREAV